MIYVLIKFKMWYGFYWFVVICIGMRLAWCIIGYKIFKARKWDNKKVAVESYYFFTNDAILFSTFLK